ncbi:hypothetical protein [Robertkochia aurantiaca]|uniref:hypothetical protein n=1 Tax=Robertkochia aurantiaca TaxID=2873700 RepID=UPI001CCB22C5|nr:hypothetical protein [Robertkochia sp. 3YJGBD-33]
MKRTKTSLNLFLLFFISMTGYSQINLGESGQGGAINFVTRSSVTEFKAQGSPYLNEEFQVGKILVNGEAKITALLRYNGYNNEIQIKEAEDKFGVIDKSSQYSAIIGNDRFEIRSYINNRDQVRTSYFIVLNEGPVKLLLKPEIKLRRGKEAQTPYERDEAPRFFESFSYYLQQADEPAREIRLKRSQILSSLKGAKGKIEKLVEDQDLSYKEEKDVIKIIEAYNAI